MPLHEVLVLANTIFLGNRQYNGYWQRPRKLYWQLPTILVLVIANIILMEDINIVILVASDGYILAMGKLIMVGFNNDIQLVLFIQFK